MCNNCTSNSEGNKEIKVEELVNIQTGRKIDMEIYNNLKENAMLKVRPELWIEWDFDKNDELGFDIYEMTKGSKKKSWWYCDIYKDRYPQIIQLKSNGAACLICNGRYLCKNSSLGAVNPLMASEWHPTLNGNLTPYDVTYRSVKSKVWWLCPDCGSSYDMTISNRHHGQNCSFCRGYRANDTNSLASLRPDIASQWHPTKNSKSPNNYTLGSGEIVWWQCEKGHEWETSIAGRVTKNTHCPICSNNQILIGYNDLWTTHPELAELLLNPEDGYKYSFGSNVLVDWKCLTCGNITLDRSIVHTKNLGLPCPNCSDSFKMPEKIMYNTLKQLEISTISQKSFSWSDNKIYDFYFTHNNLNIIIETHGKQHYEETRRKGARTLKEEQANDQYKYKLAMENGIDKYIVIDCRKSEFDFIKNNIIHSELAEIFDLSNVDWEEINYNSQKSINVEILRLWNEEDLCCREISAIVNLNEDAVSRILRNYHELGKCEYDSFRGIKKHGLKKTNVIYQFTRDMELVDNWFGGKSIEENLGYRKQDIYRCCNGKIKTSRGYIWRYEKDLIGWSVPIDNDK